MRVDVETLADPRLTPYRAIKDRDLRSTGHRFIAEGEKVVRRLLASDFEVESVLCTPRLASELAPTVPACVPLYVVPDDTIRALIGFPFHSGCLAVGLQGPLPGVTDLLGQFQGDGVATVVIAHELNNTENLGSIIRIAAGFGVAGLILGPRTADPFYRQAIRVSMGAAFTLPLVRSNDLQADLALLREAGFDLLATVTDGDALPLPAYRPARRRAIVLGSEAHGLDPATVATCSHRVTIPMQLGTDSLNVAIAAAVFLYHLSQPTLVEPGPGRSRPVDTASKGR